MSRHGGKSVVQAILVSSVLPFRLKTHDNPAGTEQPPSTRRHSPQRDRPSSWPASSEPSSASTRTGPVSEELLAWARSVSMQASLKATLGCLKSFSSTDFRCDLAAFKVPTLIIHGTEDKTVPIDASSRAAAKGIKHSTLVEYDGAPHGLFATHKRRLTKDLIDFSGSDAMEPPPRLPHRAPSDLADRLALGVTRLLRFLADTFFAKRYGTGRSSRDGCGCPGMVGATATHLLCLRRMVDDDGWIRTLMEEARTSECIS